MDSSPVHCRILDFEPLQETPDQRPVRFCSIQLTDRLPLFSNRPGQHHGERQDEGPHDREEPSMLTKNVVQPMNSAARPTLPQRSARSPSTKLVPKCINGSMSFLSIDRRGSTDDPTRFVSSASPGRVHSNRRSRERVRPNRWQAPRGHPPLTENPDEDCGADPGSSKSGMFRPAEPALPEP